MQSPQDPNPISPETTERMQLLLSRQLDGDLASEDSSELTEIQQTESLDRYLKGIRQIQQHLKSLPVKPVPLSFAASIRQAILDDSAKSRASAFAASNRGWTRRLVIPATIAACACSLVVMLRSGGLEDASRVALNTVSTSGNQEMPAASDFAPANSVVSLDSAVSPDSLVSARSAIAADQTPQEELQPFLESDDWRIVVVQVNSKDRDDVMHDIEAIVAKNNMSIRTVVKQNEAHENRFGVLLTSAGVDEEDFINSVVPQSDAKSTDWNAQNVAESSRESLIRRLQESLKTPTYSELHFGQVYVTLPKRYESVDMADPNLVAHSDVGDNADSPAPAAKTMAASPGDASTSTFPEPRKPVLVVFEFTDPSNDHI